MNDSEIETALRRLKWCTAPEVFLERSLTAALKEAQTPPHRPIWAIPTLLRWPLVAAWMLIAFFKFTKPEPLSADQRAAFAQLPPIAPAVLLAELKERRERTAACLLDLTQSAHPSPLP
jgi:hypothetical protein